MKKMTDKASSKPESPSGDYEILALDVGERRIGVARAQSRARLVEPLEIITAGKGVEFARLEALLAYWRPPVIVVGLPISEAGSESRQAIAIRVWTKEMVVRIGFAGQIVYQDETLSSREARSRTGRTGAVDDLAAGILLEDYLNCQESDANKL